MGTCPKCESEVRYLERQLAMRQAAGKAVTLFGVSAGLVTMTASCGSSRPSFNQEGTSSVVIQERRPIMRKAKSDTARFEITGTVKDVQGNPLAGAIVAEKGKRNGVLTDENGYFSLRVSGLFPIVVSYVGLIAQELHVQKGMEPLSVVMQEDDGLMGEIPVIKGPETVPAEEEIDEETWMGQIVEEMPEFPGGTARCLKYLENEIAKDTLCTWVRKDETVNGRVIIQFVVSEAGEVTNPVVLKSLTPACDKFALDIVGGMPRWKPGKQRGKPVSMKCTLPFIFKSDDVKKQKASVRRIYSRDGDDAWHNK